MKLGTKCETGYKIWNWIKSTKLGTKYEIGYKISISTHNMKFVTDVRQEEEKMDTTVCNALIRYSRRWFAGANCHEE